MSEISETEINSMTKEQNYMRGYEDGKLDVLDKIKTEIEFEIDHRTNMLCAEDVFAIFDKYKGEGEK
jgi:hypothetical protein